MNNRPKTTNARPVEVINQVAILALLGLVFVEKFPCVVDDFSRCPEKLIGMSVIKIIQWKIGDHMNDGWQDVGEWPFVFA